MFTTYVSIQRQIKNLTRPSFFLRHRSFMFISLKWAVKSTRNLRQSFFCRVVAVVLLIGFHKSLILCKSSTKGESR